MKKILTTTLTIVLSLILTFTISNIFSLYNLNDKLTFTALTYLLFIFCFITYILLSIVYIISKKIKKEKIGIKKILSILLLFISLILILGFIVVLNIDWLNYYSIANSSPFYVFILVRGLEFLLPSIILIVVSVILLLKK